MERVIESVLKRAAPTNPAKPFSRPHPHPQRRESARHSNRRGAGGTFAIIAAGPIDLRSIAYALCGAIAFFALGVLCVSLSRFDSALASIWVPHASVVALLLLARLRNELPVYAAVLIAGLGANIYFGHGFATSAFYTCANLAEIALVTGLTRRACGERPQMTDLSHLGNFLFFGGIIGPVISTLIAAASGAMNHGPGFSAAASWFLAHSMGTVLTVPAVMLIAEAVQKDYHLTLVQMVERIALILCGLFAVFLVFRQSEFPLLFLVPPVTLMVAFRLGGLGTALYVPGIAAVSSWMTYQGYGPIEHLATSGGSEIFVSQAFIAANFLTGLPIAAILAGRQRMTEQLTEGRSELALLAENVTDAVLSIDLNGVCTYASPSVRDVLGREPDDFVGHAIVDRCHEDSTDRIAATIEKMLSGKVEKERLTYRRLLDADDGSPVFIEADCAVAIARDTGERSGIIVSARDVTERIELELLLTRARRHAEHAARAKSEFLANMSHEIRTPMNGVLGFAELMLQDDLGEEHRRHTEMIVQSGRSMMLLLNDILDLSKIEAGQVTIDQAPLDLYATIAECAALHRPAAEKKGLNLVFSPPCSNMADCGGDCAVCPSQEPHPWVVTDALRLRQILLNLIGNAVKFTEQGRVEISCEIDEGEFTIAVKDTGIGISAARIESIFDPFTQGETDTARRYGGTGLGLTISRQLADLLGGQIEVESETGAGSEFRLSLPALMAEPQVIERPAMEQIEPEDLPQEARILLVEDHDVNRLLGVEMLERCGQSVDIAHDGNEAIAMVIDSVMRDKPYDLVLMDIQMPGCDGYAATRAIRAEGITPDMMPIIALTANAFPEDVGAARSAGMQAHLAKPLVFADLARALQRWLPTRIIEADSDDEGHRGFQSEGNGAQDLTEDQTKRARRASDYQTLTVETLDHGQLGKDTGHTASDHSAEANAPVQRLHAPQRSHSPALMRRWNERRTETIEAVREALEGGSLCHTSTNKGAGDRVARLVHKLAGTAAIFGEPELGDQAAALERALRQNLPADVCEALAFELLSVADDPADHLASNYG